MMQPKRTKFRKQFKGRNSGLAQRGSSVAFGDYGLKATIRARMTAREIEAARRAMTRYVKRGGQVVPLRDHHPGWGSEQARAGRASSSGGVTPLVRGPARRKRRPQLHGAG